MPSEDVAHHEAAGDVHGSIGGIRSARHACGCCTAARTAGTGTSASADPRTSTHASERPLRRIDAQCELEHRTASVASILERHVGKLAALVSSQAGELAADAEFLVAVAQIIEADA